MNQKLWKQCTTLAPALLVGFCTWGCRSFDDSLLDVQPIGLGCVDDDRRPPSAPRQDDPGEDVPSFWIALKDVDLDMSQQDGNGVAESDRIGFNLDAACTSEETPVARCRAARDDDGFFEDGVGGIDNVLGKRILPVVLGVDQMLAPEAIATQEGGRGNVLFHIRGWNGQPNDTSVDVVAAQGVFGAAGTDGARPDIRIENFQALDEAGNVWPGPRWDGGDYFWVNEGDFSSTSQDVGPNGENIRNANPAGVASRAYVTEGRLVVKIRDGLAFALAAVPLALTDLTMVVDLVDLRASEPTEGASVIAAGRLPKREALAAPAFAGACTIAEIGFYENVIDDALDVTEDPDADARNAVCDAVSVGISFRAFRVNFGGFTPRREPSNLCANEM